MPKERLRDRVEKLSPKSFASLKLVPAKVLSLIFIGLCTSFS